jgi:hypothetical protein
MRVHQTQTRIMAGRIWTSYRLTVGIDRRPAANRYRYFARVDIDILLASIAIFCTCPYRYYARFDIDIWHAPISIFCQLRYDIFASVDIDAYIYASFDIDILHFSLSIFYEAAFNNVRVDFATHMYLRNVYIC